MLLSRILPKVARFSPSNGKLALVWKRGFSSSEENFKDLRKTELANTTLYALFRPTQSVSEFISLYKNLASGEKKPEIKEMIAGRVMHRRDASNKLIFYDVVSGDQKLQVMSSKSQFDKNNSPFDVNKNIRVGDIIGINGHPGKTNLGELSIVAEKIDILAPSFHMLPTGLKDPELRFRQRYVDFIVNPEHKNYIKRRAEVIRFIRQFFEERNFIEVETPILSSQAGGAIAKPFVTNSNAFGDSIPLYMRIAPELYLKKLVVGGFERVFEVGKQFRNEGIDTKHNPEFTTCEYYQAYADYTDAIKTTEEFFSGLVTGITKNNIIEYTTENKVHQLNFQPPFQKIDFIESIESHVGPLPSMNDPELRQKLIQICRENGVFCPEPQTTSRVLDKLFSQFVEPGLIQPTFVMNHPKIMSPLAKDHSKRPGLTERFEFYVAGQELCNAYTELNDPSEQTRRFETQSQFRDSGDDEIPETDEDFCLALEYGMPPTVGWGLGVDRVCMLLSNVQSIKEILLFPFMRPRESHQTQTHDDSKAEKNA